MNEVEVKVLEIDRAAVEAQLAGLGAELVSDELLSAVFFDFPDYRLAAAGRLLRLRREGDRSLLTSKRRIGEEGAKVREEREVAVGDFEACWLVLIGLGLKETKRVEKRRASYRLGAATIAIDHHVGEHSFIPEFLEIEAGSVEEVRAVAERLGFAPEVLRPWGLPQVIQYYTRGDGARRALRP
jgi:predicted adenylyl cyclase CyaB